MVKPNLNDPYNIDAANLYKNNYKEFEKNVNDFVRKYALINK